jgi:hypothetical protein
MHPGTRRYLVYSCIMLHRAETIQLQGNLLGVMEHLEFLIVRRVCFLELPPVNLPNVSFTCAICFAECIFF